MAKGGYQIIDLKSVNLVEDNGVKIEGIYDKIEGTNKPILLCGIQIEDIDKHDVFVQPRVSGSGYTFFDVYDRNIFISDDDIVTLTH